ncbi:hypothetical protein R3P38DRAFT_3048867, partial [Favolaschia claudopus]
MDQARLPSLGLQNKRKEAPSTGKHMSDSASVAEFLHVVSVAQVVLNRSVIVGTTSILVWDWLSLALHLEIWGGWSPVKVLYCLVRYYTLVVLVVTDISGVKGECSHIHMSCVAQHQTSSCAQHVRILPGIAVITICPSKWVSIESIPLLHRVLTPLRFLGVMVAVPILAFDLTGKPSIAGPKFIIAFYASPMAFDMVMTFLTVYKVIEHNRRAGSSSLMNRIVRDGLLYFFAITSLNLLNVVFFMILNLRASSDARPRAKKFSNTRGGWVTDIAQETEEVESIHFTSRSCISPQPPPPRNSQLPPSSQEGIFVHFERNVERDGDSSSSKTQIESPTLDTLPT